MNYILNATTYANSMTKKDRIIFQEFEKAVAYAERISRMLKETIDSEIYTESETINTETEFYHYGFTYNHDTIHKSLNITIYKKDE